MKKINTHLINYSLFIFFVILNSTFTQVYQNPCHPLKFLTHHDSNTVVNFKFYDYVTYKNLDTEKLSIKFIDFTQNQDQIVIGAFRGGNEYNIAIIKKNEKWQLLNLDNITTFPSKDSFIVNFCPRQITDYKLVNDKLFLLCGGNGSILRLDSAFNASDTSFNKSYISIINISDTSKNTKVFLNDDFYASNLFYFKNQGWVVVGKKNIYWYNEDFNKLINQKYYHPAEIKNYVTFQINPISFNSFTILFANNFYWKNPDTLDYKLFLVDLKADKNKKLNLPFNKTGSINFIDSLTGYYSGVYADSNGMCYSKIFQTTDGGINWSAIYNHKSGKTINKHWYQETDASLDIFNNKRLLIFNGSYCELNISNDYGKTWSQLIPMKDTCESVILYGTALGRPILHFDTLFIPSPDYYNYTYYTYTNPLLLDIENSEDEHQEINTSKYFVIGDYFTLPIDFSDKPALIYTITGELIDTQMLTISRVNVSKLLSGTYFLRHENKVYVFIKL